MLNNRWLNYAMLLTAVLCLSCASVHAQRDSSRSLSCRDEGDYDNDRAIHCEVKEQTIAATKGTINVDARQNGGIAIKGWERNEILVRYRVQTRAMTQADADALATQIRVETANAQIIANGPEQERRHNWDVTYEIFVPRQSALSLQTHNGGIVIADVRGQIEFAATNGGVVLKRLGGNVQGHTTNGGLVVHLDGNRWDGEKLDVQTTNGGIVMSMPDNYSAHLETSTVNGSLNIGFPMTVQGRINKEISTDLGNGGATIRATTTNGGVSIRKEGATKE